HDAGWEVASPVVSGEGVTLYHGNDNTLSTDAYGEVAKRLGPIDVAFLPYAGASSYPTRFDGDAETRRRRCREKKDEGLQRFLDGIEGLRPSEAAPFASSWALLELAEVDTNFEDRLTAPEVLARAMQFAHERNTHLLHLEPGDEWSPETGALNRGLVSQHPLTAAGVRRYAELERSRVTRVQQGLRAAGEATALDALVRDFFATAWATSHAPSSVEGTFGLESGESSWTLRCAGDRAAVEPGLAADVSEILRLPPGELSKVLTGEWSWEDVWYGYRLHVTKRLDAGYARAFWERLLGIEADLVRARSKPR
ncbi:MAG: hypothetical protein MUC96_13535, partial [Myxococcaceae bacterium]|nr:hypothetical protein [Myxococcaceae bacterium]